MKVARLALLTTTLTLTMFISSMGTVHAATCVGADPCHACKNCRYCSYCAKRGGTCGVCKRR
jgi:hypothetical protein